MSLVKSYSFSTTKLVLKKASEQLDIVEADPDDTELRLQVDATEKCYCNENTDDSNLLDNESSDVKFFHELPIAGKSGESTVKLKLTIPDSYSETKDIRFFVFKSGGDAQDIYNFLSSKLEDGFEVEAGSFSHTRGHIALDLNRPKQTAIHLLYNPANHTRNIFFFHGIFGHHDENTWGNSIHLVAKDLPDARVFSVAHFGSHGEDTIQDIADAVKPYLISLLQDDDKPVSFICHSLGGLVVKRLLVDSPHLLNKIDKVVFYGTPHLGSKWADTVLSYKAFWVTCAILEFIPETTLRELTERNEALLQLEKDFSSQCGNLSICTFIEDKFRGFFNPITSKESAKGEHESERFNVPNVDHTGICKYTDNENPEYKKLVKFLKT